MEADVYSKLDEDGGKKMIYKMARDRDENSKDVKGGTVMKDRNGKLVTEQEAVLKVWESYSLPSYVEGKVELFDITDTEMQTGMKGMKKGRAPGIDEMRVEMIMAAGESGNSWSKRLLNTCMRQSKVPEEWRTGLIVPIWKKKGDVQDPGKYRGITLLSHIMKLLERIMDVRIRNKVEQELGEEQQGFRKGRGTTGGMFALRQMVEKRLEMQERMARGFVDLEKAYDTVPREMVMAKMRWMGVPEAKARMVEAMYERTKGRVVVGSGLSEEFPVNIGLTQGSALSPLLVIMVMEIISRKISTKDILRKMMYADDLDIIAESKQDLQEVLDEWKGVFEKHGLRMSLEKTEVMWVGHQREELNIRLDGKEIKQVDGFVYLGEMVTEDGHSTAEVRRRTQAGANAWRKVEGVMLDRNIQKS